MTKKAQLLALLDADNQEHIRQDLTDFFGPNAEIYLATYDKMRLASGTHRLAPMTWSWPGFLVSYAWFFYRKMYIYGAMFLLVPLVLGMLFPTASVALYVCSAIMGKTLYVQIGLGRILKADALGLAGEERKSYLQRAGGVSVLAGAIGGLIFAAALIVVILAAVGKARHT